MQLITDEQAETMRLRLIGEYIEGAAAQMGIKVSDLTVGQWDEIMSQPVLSMKQAAELTVEMARRIAAELKPEVDALRARAE